VCVPCSLCSDLCEGPWSTDTDGQTPCRVAHWPAAPPSVEGTVAEAGDSEHSHLAAHPADDIFTWSLWFPIPARYPSRAWSLRSFAPDLALHSCTSRRLLFQHFWPLPTLLAALRTTHQAPPPAAQHLLCLYLSQPASQPAILIHPYCD
jgi:hypothetical protein